MVLESESLDWQEGYGSRRKHELHTFVAVEEMIAPIIFVKLSIDVENINSFRESIA